MTRVLLVTDIFPPQIGGPATFIDRLGHALAARGHDVTVVCSSEGPTHPSDSTRPFRVVRVDLTNRYAYEVRVRAQLAAELARHRVVLVNGLEGYVGQVAPRLRRRFVLKVVGDVVWERGRNLGLVTASFDEFQAASERPAALAPLTSARRRYLDAASLVITPSHHLRDAVIGWGVASDRVDVVPNGVPLEDFSRFAPRARGDGALEVAFCGRLTNWKGVETVLLALQGLDRVRLSVIGDGPALPMLTTLAAQLGLFERVTFLGRVQPPAMYDRLAAAHVLVLPSAYEGLSHTLLEAAACGLALVASDIGGNRGVISHERNGLLAPYAVVAGLRAALARLHDNEDERLRLAKAAKASVADFPFEATVAATVQCLKL